jgi:Tol biopolymer transport system component
MDSVRTMVLIAALALGAGCDDPDDDDSATGNPDDDDTAADDDQPGIEYTCTEPVSLGPAINSEHHEMGPSLSPDGLALYFSSDRPGGAGASDLYLSTRGAVGEPWGDPVGLGDPVNLEGGQNNPAIAPDDQQLYYGANRNGDYDIWYAERDGEGWQMPICIDALVTDAKENKPALSWDGQRLYFKRSDESLIANLWVSEWVAGAWAEAVEVVDLNDERSQTDPAPSPEGDVLFFVQGADTEAPYDVYYTIADGDGWGWRGKLPGVSVTGARDEAIAVSADGTEFFLASDRDVADDPDLYTFTCERTEQ